MKEQGDSTKLSFFDRKNEQLTPEMSRKDFLQRLKFFHEMLYEAERDAVKHNDWVRAHVGFSTAKRGLIRLCKQSCEIGRAHV